MSYEVMTCNLETISEFASRTERNTYKSVMSWSQDILNMC
jgi:hypothetical protein